MFKAKQFIARFVHFQVHKSFRKVFYQCWFLFHCLLHHHIFDIFFVQRNWNYRAISEFRLWNAGVEKFKWERRCGQPNPIFLYKI